MILAATLLWSIEVIVAKRLLGSLSSLTVGTARMALGCVVLLAYVAVTGSMDDLLAVSVTQWAWAALTGGLLAAYVATWYLALARARAIDVTAVLAFGPSSPRSSRSACKAPSSRRSRWLCWCWGP